MNGNNNTPGRAMQAVTNKDKVAWLECFAPDAWVRDPVGGSPLDPRGEGFRGREAIGKLWDGLIAPLQSVRFEVREEHPSGNAIARVATVQLTLPTGATVEYPGVFVYDLDEQQRISELRGYFELPAMG